MYNYNGKKEDTLKATINANEAYVLRNKNNKAEENLFSGQELYLTEQSSSTQSFFKIQNFIGERDSNGLKKGFCIEKREDGTVFKGIYKQDYLEGYGIQIKDIGVFKGEFEENRTSGFGIYNMKNGVTYTGEWMDEMLLKENIIMVLKMDLVLIMLIIMLYIVENGIIIIWMDLEFIIILMVRIILENGKIIK